MSLVLRAVLLAMLALAASLGCAADDPQQGKLIYATCAACHGAGAGGNRALNAPRLNHLQPVYIAAQLQKFRNGTRGGSDDSEHARQMAAIAAGLADEQAMYDVAAYIATLDGSASAASVQADVALGSTYYRQFCAACHGPGAEGNPALNSPTLAGADDWYLAAQLQAFRNGVRGTHPQDRTGKQMRVMAAVLPDDQAVAAVVAYIRSLEQ
jgi:cytochrome c553